jgi:hypothetical protein
MGQLKRSQPRHSGNKRHIRAAECRKRGAVLLFFAPLQAGGVAVANDATLTEQIATSVLDKILTAQIAVAWAGESGEESRLRWWATDFCSEYGGEDLLRQILPQSWAWATIQSVREAARRADAKLRSDVHDEDVVLSLFNLGFALNERLEERFQTLKRQGLQPTDALPALKGSIDVPWNLESFGDWVSGHGKVTTETLPTGRRIRGNVPDSAELMVDKLVAGLLPFAETYPMPHYRREL